MNNNSERKKSIFYIFQPFIYTNEEKKEQDYNLDFDKKLFKRKIKKKRRNTFIKIFFCCIYDQKTHPEIKP